MKSASTWRRAPLESVAELCLGKMLDQRKNCGDFMPYLANINVRWGEIELKNLRSMRFESHELDRYGLQFGDIVMCEGGEPGRCAIWRDQLPGMMIQKALHRIRSTEALDHRFLFYQLLNTGQRRGFDRYFTGSTIKHLPGDKLAKVEVVVPPISTQRRIADILSAYDDLIENCQRRIEILEQMARALYREWFVKFRYPGHESVPLESSPLGEIPKGWGVSSIASTCARLESGGTPRRNNPELWDNGDVDWYTTSELQDNYLFSSKEKIAAKAVLTSHARVFESGTILMAIYGSPTVGRLGVLTRRSSCNQAALGLVADSRIISQNYLYFALQALRPHFNSIAQGAAQQNISKEKVANTMIVVPDSSVLERFEAVGSAQRDETRVLTETVLNLRRTRDLLLPRLISGQLEVDDA